MFPLERELGGVVVELRHAVQSIVAGEAVITKILAVLCGKTRGVLIMTILADC